MDLAGRVQYKGWTSWTLLDVFNIKDGLHGLCWTCSI